MRSSMLPAQGAALALFLIALTPSISGAILVKGSATGKRPLMRLTGHTNGSYHMTADFSMLISPTKAKIDLRVDRPLGPPLTGFIYLDTESVSYHEGAAGEAKFGPAKGRWDSMAYVVKDDFLILSAWENLPLTLLLPFWTNRFSVHRSNTIPNLSEIDFPDRHRFYHHAELVGAPPQEGSQLRLYLDDRRIRESWTFLVHTNINDAIFPMRFRRQVLSRPVARFDPSQHRTSPFLEWDVQIAEIHADAPDPILPTPQSDTYVQDHRLPNTVVTYLTSEWRSTSDLLADTNILAQLRPHGRSALTASTIVATPDNNAAYVSLIVLLLVASVVVVGAMKISIKHTSKHRVQKNTS